MTVQPRESRRLAVGCCAVDAKSLEGVKPSKFFCGLRLEWETPFRTPGKKD